MLFHSADFAVFLPVIFLLFWFGTRSNLRLQNSVLLVASYFFYAWWDYRFLLLLILSTVLDYLLGLTIARQHSLPMKKIFLWISVVANVSVLIYFKYFNFFIDSFIAILERFGIRADFVTLSVILPLGISFYTFHGLSYVFDVYRNKIKPVNNPVAYALFVSFFPLLVAGPIERATHLLPQLLVARKFNYGQAADGLKQFLWGLFKKIVIADSCSETVNIIFADPGNYTGSTLALGAIFFSVQIYADFSGYSDMALGIAKLFGIDLLRNFSYPYFSRDLAEFWRRWHISLTSWFRDYLYIPLGGNRCGVWKMVRNTFVVFLASGLWHGANWTFICWGLLHALCFLPGKFTGLQKQNLMIVAAGRNFPTIREACQIVFTFFVVTICWIFFRAQNLQLAYDYLNSLFSLSFFSLPELRPWKVILWFVFMFVIEWIGRQYVHPLAAFPAKATRIIRWGFYYFLIGVIIVYIEREQTFIYFQF